MSAVETPPGPDVAYLDRARGEEFFSRLKRHSTETLSLPLNSVAADVGCGTGEDTLALAQSVQDAFAIGFDLNRGHIAVANRRFGATSSVAFVVGDGARLPLATGVLHGCRVERTLQHVENPSAVVAEIARALRPGGRLVASEPDYGAAAIEGADTETTDRIWVNWIRRNRHPRIGRQLAALFSRAAIRAIDVRAEAVIFRHFENAEYYLKLTAAAGAAAHEQVLPEAVTGRWVEDLTSASERGEFLMAIPMFTASGVAPAEREGTETEMVAT